MEKKFFYGIIVIIVITVVILAGLFISVKEPGVEVKDIRFKSLSIAETSITFDVTLAVNNDNSFSAKLKWLEGDVFMNGDYLGYARSESEFEIKANDVSEISVILKIDEVPLTFSYEDTNVVRFKGNVYLRVTLFNFVVRIDDTVTVNL